MSDHHFFFSYSRVDKGPYLDKFFEDLRSEVYQKVGRKEIPFRDIAFRDQSNIEVGIPWSTELAAALNQSKTLICVYTPAYFRSEYCGKEVQVFRSRIDQIGSIEQAPVIIPVLWENPTIFRIPKQMGLFQHSMIEDTGELYSQKGLNYIIKLNKYQDEYKIILDYLATRIAVLVSSLDLPPLPELPNLEMLPSYFAGKEEISDETNALTLGPRAAQFIFVVGKKKELSGIRQIMDNYGLSTWEWRPFGDDNEVGIIAQNVATRKRMHFSAIDITANLMNTIKEAESNNSLVIIVVDPWSVKIKSHRDFLVAYDNSYQLNTGLVIPWNLSDQETRQKQDQLKAELYQALSHCIAGNRPDVRDGIVSLDELVENISAAIDEAQLGIMKHKHVFHKMEGSGVTSLPRVSGPGMTL